MTTYTVSSGQTTSGITLNPGDFEYVSSGGTASSTAVIGGELVVFTGGTASNATVENTGYNFDVLGAIVLSGGTAIGATVEDYAAMNVSSGGVASSTTVEDDGELYVSSGGTAIGATVEYYGAINVSSGGVASGTTLNDEGFLRLEGGTASGATVNLGELGVGSGGTAIDTTVYDTDGLEVGSAGEAIDTTLQGGIELVYSGGTASDTTVDSAGAEWVWAGGTTSGAIVNSGGLEVVNFGSAGVGGTTVSATVNDDGAEVVYSGSTASGTTVNDGGVELVGSGEPSFAGGAAIRTTVNSGGCEIVYAGATASGATVNSGGYLVVVPGSTVSDTTVHSGGAVLSTGVVVYQPNSGVTVYSSSATDIVTGLNGADSENIPLAGVADADVIVLPGGTAIDTRVNDFGEQDVYGTAIGTVNVGNENVYSGGKTSGSTDYYLESVFSGGTASGTTVNGTGVYIDPNEAFMRVFSGGTASGTTLIEGYLSVSGGTAIGTVISGGDTGVGSGGTASGTVVNSGGNVAVESGGTANGTVVNSGGVEDVYSGGTASGIVLSAGGSAVLSDGAVVSGGIVFAGGSATLQIDGLKMPTISGFAVTDTINLLDVGYDPSEFASLLAGNVLQITDPYGDVQIQLDPTQNFTGLAFALADAANNGYDDTLVTVTDLVLSGSGNSVNYTPGGAAAKVDAGLGVSDVSSATLAGATVDITSGFLAGDTLNFAEQHNIVGSYDDSTGVLTLTGSATLADYQAALDSITYDSTTVDPTDAGADLTRTIEWIVNDGTNSSNVIASTINVESPPVLFGGGNTVDYAATRAAPTVDAWLGVSDASSATLTGATVDITSGFLAGDTLNFADQDNIVESYDATSGVLTLTGTATLADYQAALESITYDSTAVDPTSAGVDLSRTVSWTVTDGTLSSNTIASTIALEPVGIKLHPGGTETNTGAIVGYAYGVEIYGGAGKVINSGTIAATATYGDGVLLENGGAVTNQKSATITAATEGDTVVIEGGPGTVTNAGSIVNTLQVTYGIDLYAGGMVTNLAGGTIAGIQIGGGAGTVVNAGTVSHVHLDSGGSVTNESGGTISDGNGVSFDGGAVIVTNQAGGTISGVAGVAGSSSATVTNAGSIAGTTAAAVNGFVLGEGVALGAGGTVTNESGGSITGVTDGVYITGGSGTVTNAGTISGANTGIKLSDGGSVTNAGKIASMATYGDGVELLDGGSVSNQKSGTITGVYQGVYISGAAGTVTNAGAIASTGTKSSTVRLGAGGTVVNEAGGTIGAVDIGGGAGTVTNAGSIAGGIELNAGGTVTNQAGGTISGGNTDGGDGVQLNADGDVANYGKIGGKVVGVTLDAGGTVTNEATGTISGGYAGVDMGFSPGQTPAPAGGGALINDAGGTISGDTGVITGGSAATVTNAGVITGTTAITITPGSGVSVSLGDGVDLGAGGAVTNQVGGKITGAADGVYVTGGAGTVTNAGAISGATDSVVFAGAGANTLTLQTGSTLTGAAVGSTFGDATNALVLQGVGTANNNFDNFDTLDVQPAALWTLGGTSSIGATLVDEAILTVTGSLTSVFTIENGGVLDYEGAFNQRIRFAGVSAGTLQVNGDTAGTVTGFGKDDVIDFETVAYSSGGSISVVASGADDTIEVLNASHQEIASFLTPLGCTASDFSLQSIDGGAGLSVTGEETVVAVAQFLAEQSTLDANPNGFIVADTAADVTTALSKLEADPHAIGITLTDFSLPILTLSPTQIESDRAALDKISKPYGIAVVDATANDTLDMKALNAPSQVVSVTLSDGGKVVNEAGLSIEATGGGVDGVEIEGGSGTVTNTGTITATATNGRGVVLEDGGTVTNYAGGTITGARDGVYITGGSGTVTNAGSIVGTGNGTKYLGTGILIWGTGTSGSSVYNQAGGAISASGYFVGGVYLGQSGSVNNAGTITVSGKDTSGVGFAQGGAVTNSGAIDVSGTYGSGVSFFDGGTLNNLTGGAIDSTAGDGVYAESGAAASVTNKGTISGSGDGIQLDGGGAVTNESGATVAGGIGVYITGGVGSVTNAGTISGSVVFAGAGANTLTLQTGSTLTGDAVGSTASGASVSNALVLQGAGVANNNFDHFDTLNVEATGAWTLGGDSTIGATTVSSGTLIVTGDLISPVTLAGGGAAAKFESSFQGDVTFQGVDALSLSQAYGGTIDGFGVGDTIDLTKLLYDKSASSYSLASGSGANDEIVTVHEGAATYSLQFEQTPALSQGELTLAADANGDTEILLASPPPPLPPVLSGGGNNVDCLVDGAPAPVDVGLGVVDPSRATLAGATVDIASGFLAGDQLNFTNQNGITGSYNASKGALTLTGTASVADYQAALESITYSLPAGDATSSSNDLTRTINWRVTDGATASNTVASTINLDFPPPILSGGGNTVKYTTGGPAITIDAGLAVADPSSATLTGATVDIGGGFLGGDTLNFNYQNGIDGSYDSSTGALTLTGTASLADYHAALDSITYSSYDPDPTEGGADTSRTVDWTATSGALSSDTVASTIKVGPTPNYYYWASGAGNFGSASSWDTSDGAPATSPPTESDSVYIDVAANPSGSGVANYLWIEAPVTISSPLTTTIGNSAVINGSANAEATVDVSGLNWNCSGIIVDGGQGTGSLTISNSGSVDAVDINLGNNWNGPPTNGGSGVALIESGGALTTAGLYDNIGLGPDTTGAVTVTGVGSHWTSGGAIEVGSEGDGTLTISNDGSVHAADGFGVGNLGPDSTNNGSTGALLIESGGTAVTGGWAYEGGYYDFVGVPAAGPASTVTVTGEGSSWTMTAPLAVEMTGVVSAAAGGAIHADDGIYLCSGSSFSVDATSIVEAGALGGAKAGFLTIDANSFLQGAGTVSGAVDDNGQITASGGTLIFEGPETASGNLTIDASGTLAFSGPSNSIAGAISGAGTVLFSGGSTTLKAGVSAKVANLAESGSSTTLTLAENLSYGGVFTQGAGSKLVVDSGDTLTLTGTTILAGTTSGAGTLDLSGGGSTSIDSGAKISVSAWSLLGSGTSATLDENLAYAGKFSEAAGDTLDLAGGYLVLTGSDTFSGGTVDGSNRLYTEATTLLTDGLTIGGTASLENTKTLTQSGGAVTIGDNAGNKALLYNTSTGTYAIADDSGIGRGSSTASYIANAGLFEKTGGTGTSAISASFTDTGTVTVASGALSFSGPSNSFTGAITGAGTVLFAGGSTTLKNGASASVAALSETNTGTALTIAENLSYGGAFTEGAGSTLSVSGGDTLTLTGTTILAGTTSGAGTLDLSGGGSTSIDSGAKISVSAWSLLGSGTSATLDENLAYAGKFSEAAGDTLDLAGGYLVLTGSDTFSGGTVDGSNRLYTEATTLLTDGLTIGGTASLENTKTLTQSGGAVTIGDNAGNKALLYNTSTGTYAIADDSGIGRGSSTASYIANAGLFEKTGGTGTSAIAPALTNTGTVLVSSGVLDLRGAVSGTGADTISGASTLEFDSTIASGQTIGFTGAGGTLDLGDPQGLSGKISGFDTVGSNDTLEIAAPWTSLGFSENAADTQGLLTFANGATHISFTLLGDYTATNFGHQAGPGGSTLVTYK